MSICGNFPCMGRPPGVRYPIFITVRVDEETKRELDGIAESEDRSLANATRALLMRGLEDWKREHSRRGRGVRKGTAKG